MTNISTILFLCVTVWAASEVLGSCQGSCSCGDVPCSRIRRRDDYWYVDAEGAYKLHTRGLTWNDARKACAEEGAKLAIINSNAEAAALSYLFRNLSATIESADRRDIAILGFHDLYGEGDYVTIEGDTLGSTGYNGWGKKQPDNAGGNENCGSMWSDGTLNDINCKSKYAFFCELPVWNKNC